MMAQEIEVEDPTYTDGKRHKEFIVNTTPLIAQFVPFNASSLSKLNLFDYQYRKLRNGKGIRWGFGIDLGDEITRSTPQFLYLRLGWVRRKQVSNHFHFSRALDLNLMAEDIDSPSNQQGKVGFNGIGLSYSLGFEYSFNKHLAISTEGSLLLGQDFNEGQAKVRFIPPVGLFFHVKL
jgi:hypothetical protein